MTEKERNDIIDYRIGLAYSTLKEVISHRDNGFYNTAINRLYYACYYATSALLLSRQIETKSHDGVRQMLGKEFVLTGKMDPQWGRFYSQIFGKRTTGDYEDFVEYTKDTVDDYYNTANDYIKVVDSLIDRVAF